MDAGGQPFSIAQRRPKSATLYRLSVKALTSAERLSASMLNVTVASTVTAVASPTMITIRMFVVNALNMARTCSWLGS